MKDKRSFGRGDSLDQSDPLPTREGHDLVIQPES
jgi:hypothetical protein